MQTQSLNAACYFKINSFSFQVYKIIKELGFQMRLHNNVNLVVPCSIFFVPLLHCAVCQRNHGYIIGLSFSSLSGLSTKKLQTQYCPVRFTWHRGSIMLPCQQKTNKPSRKKQASFISLFPVALIYQHCRFWIFGNVCRKQFYY